MIEVLASVSLSRVGSMVQAVSGQQAKELKHNVICFLESLSVTHEKISASVLILQPEPSTPSHVGQLPSNCQSIDCVPRSHSSGDEHNRSPEEDPQAVWIHETQQALS